MVRDFRDPMRVKAVYCSIVRSVINYAQVVWKLSFQCLSASASSKYRSKLPVMLCVFPLGKQAVNIHPMKHV